MKHNLKATGERLYLGNLSPVVERAHLERYSYACKFVRDKDVCDVACGTGYGSKMMLDSGAHTVHGIDISEEAIKYAAEYYNGKNLTYEVGDAEKLDGLQDNTFDVVISFETIEHLKNSDRYIAQIFRVLKPGGSLIISTPDRRLASSLYPLRGKPNNPYHIHEFTHDQFLNFLGNKFHVVECLGQAYVESYLAFWPIQVLLKTICYVFRRFGAYRIIERIFDVGTGLSVEPHRERKDMIARFWIARCIKMTGYEVGRDDLACLDIITRT